MGDRRRALWGPARATACTGVSSDLGDGAELLAHDGVTEVWRVGSTVRRPARLFTVTVDAFLRQLRLQGIDFVPRTARL